MHEKFMSKILSTIKDILVCRAKCSFIARIIDVRLKCDITFKYTY